MNKVDFEEQSVRRETLEWFDNAAESFDRVAKELRRYRADFELSFDSYGTEGNTFTKPSDVLAGALNATASAQGNARFDLAVMRATRLAAVEDRKRQKRVAAA